MRKSVLVLMGLLVVLSMVLSACSPAATPTATEAPAAEEATEAPVVEATEAPAEEAAPVELKMWIMPNGSDPQGMIDAEIAAFEAENPGITITAEVVGWGDAYSKIQTAAQGGEGPCITQVGTTWVPAFAAMGGLRPFTADEIAAVGGEAAFVPASWQAGTLADDGQMYALPWFADVRALGYRTDILEQTGLTPEEAFASIDSFIATLEKVRDLGLVDETGAPVAAFAHPGKNDWNVWQNASMWIWQYGGELLSEDGTTAAFNSDAAVKAMAAYTSLYANGLTPADTLELNSSSTEARFHSGGAFSYFTGPWEVANSKLTGDSAWAPVVSENYGIVLWPAGEGGQYTFVGGSNLGIFNSCPNQAEAVKFVEYLAGAESQVRYSTAVSMLPATIEGQNDPYFKDDPMFAVFLQAAQIGKTPMPIAQWGAVENNLQTAIQGIWEQVAANGIGNPMTEEQIKTMLDDAALTVNDLLAQ